MKKMTNYVIVLCIALAASTTHSLETEALTPASPTWWAFFSHPVEFTQNLLRVELDSMLSHENKNASIYYNRTMEILMAAQDVVERIAHTIEEKSYVFNSFHPHMDEARKQRSRKIFEDWVQTGFDLGNKYYKYTKNNVAAAESYYNAISTTERVFDKLRLYRTELDACINVVDSFGWNVPIVCTAWCGFKILRAMPTTWSALPAYEKAVEDLKTLLDEVENSDECPNFTKDTSPELKKFNWEAIRILDRAENYDDL